MNNARETKRKHLIQIKENNKTTNNLTSPKVLPVCFRCARVPDKGLYDGFRVGGMFFCSNCQQELLTADQGSPEYHEFIYFIKELLYKH